MADIFLEEVCDELLFNDNFVIAIHKNPDGDAIGSSLALHFALKKLGKKSKIVCSDPLPSNFSFLCGTENINFFYTNITNKNFLVTVDVATTELLGDHLENIKENIDLSIDHHASCACFAKKNYVDSKASATTEIIYEIIKRLEVMDEKIGDCIYAGILTDTGFFKNPNVTAKTHKIVYELMKSGIKSNFIIENLSKLKTIDQMRLYHSVLGTLNLFLNNRCSVSYVTKEMINKFGLTKEDSSSFTNISNSILGVIVGVFIREENEKVYKISVRTKGSIDASEICMQFGGGGHLNAAGCIINGSLKEVKNKILHEISKQKEFRT